MIICLAWKGKCRKHNLKLYFNEWEREQGRAEEEVGVRSVLSFTAQQQLKQGDVIIAHCATIRTVRYQASSYTHMSCQL